MISSLGITICYTQIYMSKKEISIISAGRIEHQIHYIRGQNVMIDRDLADLYSVKTQALNQAVRRNRARFPEDFMFRLMREEYQNLISQFVISSGKHGGLRALPYVFTEQGVAMLSSVLKSKKAIAVNIQIVRTFTKLREMVADSDALRRKLDKLEAKYDGQFSEVFRAIQALIIQKDEPREEIGFKLNKL